ncbi:DUF559 domain-containing protein [Actinomadura fibrosa]|uniref:DUF559 domain-containing protein n=2 Tax=Actinomadura fibrosa TaxID=111802 RepID=A0ABW2XRB1_9ACTN
MRFGNTIVEMDGSWWHRGMEDRDRAKTRALTEAGYSVVRVRESPLKSLSPMDVQVFDLEDTFDAAATVLFHLARITDATVLHETAQRYLEGETLLAAGQAARMIRERLLQED